MISDVPVADEAGGQVLPAGYRVKEIRKGVARRIRLGSFRAKFPDALADASYSAYGPA